jgi:hypothetical protein
MDICFFVSEILIEGFGGLTNSMQSVMGLTFAKIVFDSSQVSKTQIGLLSRGECRWYCIILTLGSRVFRVTEVTRRFVGSWAQVTNLFFGCKRPSGGIFMTNWVWDGHKLGSYAKTLCDCHVK